MSKLMHSSLLLIALPAAACANYASFQEADTIPKGEAKTGVGATYTTYEVEVDDTKEKVGVPALNVWHRRGFTDKLEGHASVWIPLGASAGVKYQVLGDRKTNGFGVSLGADLGVLQISAEDADGNVAKATIATSTCRSTRLRVSPGFATYVSPSTSCGSPAATRAPAPATSPAAPPVSRIGTDVTLHLEAPSCTTPTSARGAAGWRRRRF